jgi:acid phosphatase family membrane protein YuiD
MKFLLIPLVALFVNQLIKFIVQIWRKKKYLGNRIIWSLVWVGAFPSAHSAVLASCVYLIWLFQGFGPLFGFSVFVSIIIIYGLLEDKKRQVLWEQYFEKRRDVTIAKIVDTQVLIDFSGHTIVDIICGALLGLITAILLINYFHL